MVKAPESPVSPWIKDVVIPPDVDETLGRRIIMRRRQLLLHTYLSVHMNRKLVQDSTYRSWSQELQDLQAVWGAQGFKFYDDLFSGYDNTKIYDVAKAAAADSSVVNAAMRMIAARQALDKKEKEPSPL